MKTTILAAATVALLGSAASAQDLVNYADVYGTKMGSADTALTMEIDSHLSYGLTDAIVAMAGTELSITDTTDLELSGWYVGAMMAGVTLTVGEQSGMFTESTMNQLGGASLGTVATGEYSIKVSTPDMAVMVGVDSTTEDWTNVQATTTVNADVMFVQAVDLVADYQNVSGDYALGADVHGKIGAVNTDLTVTYTGADESVGYELAVGTQFGTMGVNGFMGGSNTTETVDYVGAGLLTNIDVMNVWAEATYDLDTEDTDMAVGVSFAF